MAADIISSQRHQMQSFDYYLTCTKKASISADKKLLLWDGSTFQDFQVREKLGIIGESVGKKVEIHPRQVPGGLTLFVNSTSHNRKLAVGDVLFKLPESLKRENDTSSAQGKKRARKDDTKKNPPLPTDVLAHILSFIRFPPRLRYVSLVSKQWRAAVLLSVTRLSLAYKDSTSVNSAVKLFPSITALEIWCRHPAVEEDPIDLPIRLLSFRFDNMCPMLRVVPPLQSLKFATENWESSSRLSAVLHASKTSLHCLDLRADNADICAELVTHVLSKHFPNLTHLQVTTRSNSSSSELDLAIKRFYERHAGQLQSLSVSRDCPSLSGIAFPSLQKLKVSDGAHSDQLAALMSSSPNLVSVKTAGCEDLLALPRPLQKLITHLTFDENDSAEDMRNLLDHLPGVRLLSGCFTAASDISEMLVGHPSVRIVNAFLRFNDGSGDAQEEVVEALRLSELKDVKKLMINDVETDEFGKLLKSVDVMLPCLESVEIYLNDPSCKGLRRVMQFFTSKCPRLTRLVDEMGDAHDNLSEYEGLIEESFLKGVRLAI